MNVNHIIVQKLVEELLRNSHLNPYIINFEQELGSDSAYALKHWQHILRDLVKKYGITVKKTQTGHSKYNRARPTANMIRQNRLFFDDRIKPRN